MFDTYDLDMEVFFNAVYIGFGSMLPKLDDLFDVFLWYHKRDICDGKMDINSLICRVTYAVFLAGYGTLF